MELIDPTRQTLGLAAFAIALYALVGIVLEIRRGR